MLTIFHIFFEISLYNGLTLGDLIATKKIIENSSL